MAVKHDLEIEQGSTWVLEITYADSEDQPIDLTGYKARCQLRTEYDAATAALSIGTEAPLTGITIPAPGNGTVRIEVSAAVTAVLTPGPYKYDVEIESPGGFVKRLVEGIAVVTPEVTK